jgi:putative endonuclease
VGFLFERNMASVYILFSRQADSYYIGSCKELVVRLEQHAMHTYEGFTSNHDDWILHYSIDNLEYKTARRIEQHIKKMKSRKYLEDLVRFPEISEKLVSRYR